MDDRQLSLDGTDGPRRRVGSNVYAHPALSSEHRAVLDAALVLADAGSAPTLQRRTPQPKISRNSRHNLSALTLDAVLGILREAEDGFTERLADLWLRMLKTDAHLWSVWRTLLAPVYSSRVEISPAVGSGEAGALAAAGCEEAVGKIENLSNALSALLDAEGIGYGVAEIYWGRGTLLGREAWVPMHLKPVHPRRFGFSDLYELGLYDGGRAQEELKAIGVTPRMLEGKSRPIAALEPGKYVVHQPVTIHDFPTSTGLVHAVARWWWVKQAVTKYWLSGAEQFANPRFIGRLPSAARESVSDNMREGLENLASDGVVILEGKKEDVDLEIIESKGEAAARVWEMLFNRMDAAMSKAILGSTLNVENNEGVGARAVAESQGAMTIDPRREQVSVQLWASISRDLFGPMLYYNQHIFGPNAPRPKARSVVMAEDAIAVDAIAIGTGYITVDEVRTSRGLPPLGGAIGESFVGGAARV